MKKGLRNSLSLRWTKGELAGGRVLMNQSFAWSPKTLMKKKRGLRVRVKDLGKPLKKGWLMGNPQEVDDLISKCSRPVKARHVHSGFPHGISSFD